MAITEKLAKLEADLTAKQAAAIEDLEKKIVPRIDALEEAFLGGAAPKPAAAAASSPAPVTVAGPDVSKLVADIKSIREELLAMRAAGVGGVVAVGAGIPRPLPTIGGPFDDTLLLTLKQQAILVGWAMRKDSKWRLIYRASRDGDGCGHFHNRCDGLGPTMVVIRTHDGYLLGGFNTSSWNTSGAPAGSNPDSFIFELCNNSGAKYPANKPGAQFSCFNDRHLGPAFGGTIKYLSRSGPISTDDPHETQYDIMVSCLSFSSLQSQAPLSDWRPLSLSLSPPQDREHVHGRTQLVDLRTPAKGRATATEAWPSGQAGSWFLPPQRQPNLQPQVPRRRARGL